MSKISEVEREILIHIQRNSSLKKRVSLSELAEECHVSQSAIVKFAKKLGYSGYVEMVYKMYREKEWAESFRVDLIEGDLEWAVGKIARKLREFEKCKNIIAKVHHSDLLGTYFSRKLQMFDIFAVDTYDYAMLMNPHMKRGFALFFTGPGYGDSAELMKVAQKEGYYVIALAEEEPNQLTRYADFYVIFKKNNYKTADFYNARLIIFLEMVLSEYARLRKADEEAKHENG